MKKASQLLVLAVVGLSVTAHAGPVGPSARMAAWLKKHPGSKWLAHYLPDDRYKIAGGVWKFVSTDLDTYYHRPNSPLMLRQSANRVIGFANAEDAEEAGYKPEPGLSTSGDFPGFSSSSQPTIKLNKAEIAYLVRIDSMLDTFSDLETMRPGSANFSIGQGLSRAAKAFRDMTTAPIPPRFSSGGQKLRDGFLGLARLSDSQFNAGQGTMPIKELQTNGMLIGQGIALIGKAAGVENMKRYITLKGAPGFSSR